MKQRLAFLVQLLAVVGLYYAAMELSRASDYCLLQMNLQWPFLSGHSEGVLGGLRS